MEIPLGTQVSAIMSHYARLTENMLDRWKTAAVDSRNGQYTPQKFISHVVASWMDMAEAYYPPLPFAATVSTPVVQITVDPAKPDAFGAVVVPDPGVGKLEPTALNAAAATQLGAKTPDPIDPKNMVVQLFRNVQPILVVRLNLDPKRPLQQGDYSGFVKLDTGQTIAQVVVKVP